MAAHNDQAYKRKAVRILARSVRLHRPVACAPRAVMEGTGFCVVLDGRPVISTTDGWYITPITATYLLTDVG